MLMPQVRRVGIARVDAPGSRYKRFWALMARTGRHAAARGDGGAQPSERIRAQKRL
jgi:hypothetical protein